MEEVLAELRSVGIPSLEVLGTLEKDDLMSLFRSSPFLSRIHQLHTVGADRAIEDVRQIAKRGLPPSREVNPSCTLSRFF